VIAANYQLLWGKAQVPAGASRMLAFFRMIGEGGWGTATGADPYVFFTQALLARSHANQTEPSPWSPGGVTEVVGGMIRTRTVAADRLIASSITATEIAGSAVTADKLAANSVVAGKIAAGAVSATEIAASAIVASKLAATELITLSAQIGTGVITSAKIGNLEVGTLKIANNAVTATVSAAWGGSHSIGAEQTLASIGIGDANGGAYLIFVDVFANLQWIYPQFDGDAARYGSHIIRLRRNGVLLFEQVVYNQHRTAIRADIPGAGVHTYAVSVAAHEGSNTAQYALIAAIQTKK
jgi:hypothetical protein